MTLQPSSNAPRGPIPTRLPTRLAAPVRPANQSTPADPDQARTVSPAGATLPEAGRAAPGPAPAALPDQPAAPPAEALADGTPVTDAAAPASPLPRRGSKAAMVVRLLSRLRGASLEEVMAATSWQPHSTRAFLTGLRKRGVAVLRESRPDGTTCWRIGR